MHSCLQTLKLLCFVGDNQGNLTKMQFGRLETDMLVFQDGESSSTVFQG